MEVIKTPTLVEHLKACYDKHLTEVKATAESPLRNDLGAFLAFANTYLSNWRPSAISHKCEMNYIITLQDRQEVMVSPEYSKTGPGGVQVKPGDMAPGRSVSISAAKAAPGDRSLEDGSAIRIDGRR